MEINREFNEDLFSFIDNSPTAFHAVKTMVQILEKSGFTQLHEKNYWNLERGSSYFVTRDNGSLIAFSLGESDELEDGFRMVGSHSDSPGLQLKPAPAIKSSPYLQLGVEIYGGPLLNPWFDRDLSIAGRVCCTGKNGKLVELLVDFLRPVVTIPSLAIHFDREANENRSIDKQKSLPLLFGQPAEGQSADFSHILKNQLQQQYPETEIDEILGFDLFCYDTQQLAYLGLNNEFITGSRLDNLLSCHLSLRAMIEAGSTYNTLFFCANHEENGSTSSSGAQSSFLQNVLQRIIPEQEKQQIALRNSMLISVDNAHAVHPNFPDKSDPQHAIKLNHGPVIKINANQRYATSSRTNAIFKLHCKEVDVSAQEFVMVTGMPCGSTIGPMTAAKLGVETLDVGAPTFGMHSIREVTGASDPFLLYKVVANYLSSSRIHI